MSRDKSGAQAKEAALMQSGGTLRRRSRHGVRLPIIAWGWLCNPSGASGYADKRRACMPQDLGSTQPAPDPSLQLPPEVVQRLRNIIFGFDFFVTKVGSTLKTGNC